jgi:SSS family solute:Na+ symporter
LFLPGIAAYVLYTKGGLQTEILGRWNYQSRSVLPRFKFYYQLVLKVSFAALTAAVVASLAGKVNKNISTILRLIFKKKKFNLMHLIKMVG